jgi:hypothetical protein
MTDRKGKENNNPSLVDVQKALTNLLLGKDIEKVKDNYVFLINDSELALEIYQNTIILQDYGRYSYDGPGGSGEILRVRA